MTETQLTSRFYLITLQGHPVYVGYTNRPIKQRFAEHKHDKDFGDIEPEITLLDTLSFDFSWDIGVINAYAQQVDDRERELVAEYETQDSVYQKAIGGGQTWADVKHFVWTNHDNPKFTGLADDEILAMVAQANALRRQFLSIIYRTRPAEQGRLGNVIRNTRPAEEVRLRNVINRTKPAEELRLKSIVSGTNPAEQVRLRNVVTNTEPAEQRRVRDLINSTKPTEEVRLKSIVSSTKPAEQVRFMNVISHTEPAEEVRLRNVVNNTKPVEEVRLRNIVGHTEPAEQARLKSIIRNTQTKQEN